MGCGFFGRICPDDGVGKGSRNSCSDRVLAAVRLPIIGVGIEFVDGANGGDCCEVDET